jgi:hypothetical protein
MRVNGGGRARPTEPLRVSDGSVTVAALHVAGRSGARVGGGVQEEMKWAPLARRSNGDRRGVSGPARLNQWITETDHDTEAAYLIFLITI